MTDGSMRVGGGGGEMTGGRYVHTSGGNGVYTRLRQVGFVGIGISLADTDAITSDI